MISIMDDPLNIESIQSALIEVRGQQVLIDSDVARIYGVQTRDVNKAVRNNLSKFPEDYIFEITNSEKLELVENFHRFRKLKHSTVNPKAFYSTLEVNLAVLKLKHSVKRAK